MNKNRLIIASAGSGKTTKIVNEALSLLGENVLITTYTEANAAEIRRKFIEKRKALPSNITIQTWFSFLIQHGVKPYQGALNEMLYQYNIRGLSLSDGESGIKYTRRINDRTVNVTFKEDGEFIQHYFTNSQRIYSDKLSKFVFKANLKTANEVIERISRIYSNVFIDEVQDLAGYDLEFIKLLFESQSQVLLVGDPRQVTYVTHHARKNAKYRDGNIKGYLLEKCHSLIKDGIDEVSLIKSHRNNRSICEFSSKLYPNYPSSVPCSCCENAAKDGFSGVYLVKSEDVNSYLASFNPMQLRWNLSVLVNHNHKVLNYGESKGMTFDRVLIYPTLPMRNWIMNNEYNLKNEARAKFYVGLTRARYSSAIVFDYCDQTEYDGMIKYHA
ncbi:MAG: UvrD-helicase domain-containing protein [Balneolales bacterium]